MSTPDSLLSQHCRFFDWHFIKICSMFVLLIRNIFDINKDNFKLNCRLVYEGCFTPSKQNSISTGIQLTGIPNKYIQYYLCYGSSLKR